MAVAEIIGAVIGVMMLVIVAYMLVGSVLTAAEIVNNAQKDNTLQQEIRLGTSFEILEKYHPPPGNFINISIKNTGSEVIRDFPHMDVFTYEDVAGGGHERLNPTDSCSDTGTWCRRIPDNVIPNQLDPDKTMWINATLSDPLHNSIRVITSNGVYHSTTI